MKEGYAHITMVLDRSSSMSVIRQETIQGVNDFIKEQKAVPGTATITLNQFNANFETVYKNKDIHYVPELSLATFVPSGFTALLDAVGRSIDETGQYLSTLPEDARPSKVYVVIVTDGEENRSRLFTKSQIKEKIVHQTENYKWEFLFIGANLDAIQEAASYGISLDNAINWTENDAGTKAIYSSVSGNVSRSRVSGQSASFTLEDRMKQAEALRKNSPVK